MAEPRKSDVPDKVPNDLKDVGAIAESNAKVSNNPACNQQSGASDWTVSASIISLYFC